MVEQADQPVGLEEEESRSLVGGEPPGEPYGEHLGIQDLLRRLHHGGARPLPRQLGLQTVSHEEYESLPPDLVRPPQLDRRNRFHTLPHGVVRRPFQEPGPQVPREQVSHLVGEPAPCVDAVRDAVDGDLGLGQFGPQVLPLV